MATSQTSESAFTFGPVPSRRLGRSLGINNIPPKICSYSCVYCQVGRTLELQVDRRTFFPPGEVVARVASKVDRLRELGEPVDYLTIVSDGEPTLDENLGRVLRELKPLAIKTAVITNGSLVAREDVRADLSGADWVSLKVDAVHERIWRRLNRPHRDLDLRRIMRGMREFSREFRGELVTETMLVRGFNEEEEHLRDLASFLADLGPDKAYLAIPIRPPVLATVRPPEETVVNRSFQIVKERLRSVEYLIGYEGNAFASTGNAGDDLLAITAVHPMKREAVEDLLARTGSDWAEVDGLLARGLIVATRYHGEVFYVRSRTTTGGKRRDAP